MSGITAIFDIGKTNKKFYLFDEQFRDVHQVSARFPELPDDDGFPGEDLSRLESWMRASLQAALRMGFDIRAVNFSAYGASFVHLDEGGRPVTPLYNYTKPFPGDLLDVFYARYGGAEVFARETASPRLGMLNSGLQLYWLKKKKPELFAKIRTSLHLPQYCSFLFSGRPQAEYTSIGCHTALWDYGRHHYHRWVLEEGLDRLFPPLAPAGTTSEVFLEGKTIRLGAGIHDSSAALLPYLAGSDEPFLLLSTGTWSIALNPFSTEPLTTDELRRDCLQYLRPDGRPVKAARLFLGHEHQLQVEKLNRHFGKKEGYHRTLRFDPALYRRLPADTAPKFRPESLPAAPGAPAQTDLSAFSSFAEAYHQLMRELVAHQREAIRLALGNTALNRIYIDGGFVENDLYVRLLALEFPEFDIYTAASPRGSALGAALAVLGRGADPRLLQTHFALRRQEAPRF